MMVPASTAPYIESIRFDLIPSIIRVSKLDDDLLNIRRNAEIANWNETLVFFSHGLFKMTKIEPQRDIKLLWNKIKYNIFGGF